ncbi:uncharacterized protein B0J16DRAFT_401425 [Fusarium flagelliforme]|uniref:uncharacterized protein n=1 Tax=Fusarium flagelliforme TaxID=2675880 RepID=UPI001E8DC158|nr:uncharacterized protein B0J16DRAFT_401425 [Fusarium flagelliforme]KAH7183219.1 hypothetical protein B0J16DRAFT_401425 [Fusarium flagelliforme]
MYPTTPTITNHAEEKDPPPSIANPLDEFPADILLQICGSLPSLDTLWNLMRASPMVWRLFDCYHNTMIESVLSGPNSITPPRIRKLIRAMVFMRSGKLPFDNLKEFQIFMNSLFFTYFCDHNEHRQWLQDPKHNPFPRIFDRPKQDLGPGSLPRTTAHTSRSVVATAYHVSGLSQSCLSSYLARLRDPKLKLLHPAHRPSDDDIALCHEQLEDSHVVSTPVPSADMGQPMWPEEIRVVRAMWVIKMLGELKYFVECRAETIGWSNDDVSRLRDKNDWSYLIRFCLGPRVEFEFDATTEVKAAVGYLATRGRYRSYIYFRLPRAPTPSADNRWVTGIPTCSLSSHVKLTPSTPEEPPQWDLIEYTLTYPAFGSHLLSALRYNPRRPDSVAFDSFHPLGFAFWEESRLKLLGLVPDLELDSNTDRSLLAAYLFALESILSPMGLRKTMAADLYHRIWH